MSGDNKGGKSGGVTLFSENRGAFAPTRKYILDEDGKKGYKIVEEASGTLSTSALTSTSTSNWLQSTRVTLRQVFLPYGYPQSVSKDYVTYQIWDTMQAFASSITGALATEAVMKGVGVGNEAATPLAAALTWLLKSGSGHVGQIVFAWAKGTSLDHDCKKWRLFADGLNDIATFIDLISPVFPTNMVVFVLCSASVSRALVGVAGSATRAAVTQHQARMNNMADVSAKDGSQETLVNLVALVTSLILLPIVSGKIMAVWLLYVIFTCVHLFANYKAVTSLEIETLNRPRLLMCLQDYIKSGNVSSVKTMNQRESVILGRGLGDSDVCGLPIKLGVQLDAALAEISDTRKHGTLERLILQSTSAPFLIIPSASVINVILHENIQPRDILEAFCRSIFLATVITERKTSQQSSVQKSLSSIMVSGSKNDAASLNPMDRAISKEWENFERLAKNQGFIFSQAPIETGEWRAKWIHQ